MQISKGLAQANATYAGVKQQPTKQTEAKQEKGFGEIDANMNAKQISNAYFLQYSQQISVKNSQNIDAQGAIFGIAKGHIPQNLVEILGGIDFGSIGYTGKPISELSQDEASALVAEDGFFGIAKTSERIAGFVLAGAGDDVEKLKAGREGILQGFKDAEKVWGGKLPDISQQTIEKSLEAIDKKLAELGEKVVNVSA